MAAPPPSATAPRTAPLPVPLPAQRQRPSGASAPPRTGQTPLAAPAGGPGTDAPLAGSLPLRPTIQRRTGATVSTEASGETMADTVPSRLPVLPVARTPDPGLPTSREAAGQSDAGPLPATGGLPGVSGDLPPAAVGAERDPAHSALVRPLAGRRPLRPSVAAQRAAAGANVAPAPSGSGPAASGGPVLPPDVSSIRGVGQSRTGAQAPPDSGGPAGIAAVSRAVPVARQHEAATTHPIPGPRAQSGPPGPAGSLPDLRAVTVDGARPASRTATVPMPLARAAAPAPAPVAEPTVSRSVGSPPTWPTVQPGPAPEPSGVVLAPTATPVIQRVEGAAPVVESSTSSAPSDEELDALVKASFGRFRTRLRNELIHEREARGLTFDIV